MADLSVTAARLQQIAAGLRDAGQRGLLRELQAGMRRATDPVPDRIREGLRPHLPDRYADVLNASLEIRKTTQTGPNPGVKLQGRALGLKYPRKLGRLDDGVLAHPLFGDRKHWYEQPVEAEFFTGPCRDAVPEVLDAITAALDGVAAKTLREGP